MQAAGTVFADASDEYSSVGAVLARLQDWQAQQPGAYRDAYMGVSAPAIFAPFVRLQLLAWDPLWGGTEGTPGFGDFCRSSQRKQSLASVINFVEAGNRMCFLDVHAK